MITLFVNPTEELTQLERQTLIPMLVDLLDRTNFKNRFTGRQIIKFYSGLGYPVSQQRLCRMVSYLRCKNVMAPNVIIGSNSGYFITADAQIIEGQIESLNSRCDSMRCVVDALTAQKISIEKMNSANDRRTVEDKEKVF